MELVSEDGTYIANPSGADIEEILHGLGCGGNRCAALLRSDTEMLEAKWCGESRFSFQVDGPAGHIESAREDISLEMAIATFYAYSRYNPHWKTWFKWAEAADAARQAATGTQESRFSWRK